MSTGNIPPAATFFGFSSTKCYFPVEAFHEYFSTTYARRMLGDLVFFMSEAEARAKGFTPTPASGGLTMYKDMTGKELVGILAGNSRAMLKAVEELDQAQQQPLAWFRRWLLGDRSEEEAIAKIKIGLMDLAIKVGRTRVKLEQEHLEFLRKIEQELTGRWESLQKREGELQKAQTYHQGLNEQVRDLRKSLQEQQEQQEQLQGQSNENARKAQELQGELQTARTNNQNLNRQLSTLQQKSASDTQSLTVQVGTAQKRVEELEKEKALFIPPERDNVLSSIRDYLGRLYAAKDKVVVKSVELRRNKIHTLFYSNNPSEVAVALIQHSAFNEKVRQGGKRVLEKDMLLGFAGVLGYHNLYLYLLQVPPSHQDGRFLHILCDLSFPSWQVEAAASNIEAVAWLAKHLPPQGDVLGAACCFTYYGSRVDAAAEDMEIARAIIELEKQSLLDFRKSLYVAVSAIAPLTLEPAKEPTPPVSGPTVRIVNHEHPTDLGVHMYTIEIEDASSIPQPFRVEVPVNSEGKIIELDEEEE